MTGFSKMEGFFPSFPTIVSPSFRSWGRPRRRVKTLRSVGGWIYWQFGSRCLFGWEKIPWRLRQMLSKTQRLYIHDIVCIYIYVCRIYVYIHIYINVCIVFLYIYIYTNQNVPFSHSFGRTQKYKEKDCWAIVSSIYKRSNPPQKKKKKTSDKNGVQVVIFIMHGENPRCPVSFPFPEAQQPPKLVWCKICIFFISVGRPF